MGLFIVYCFWDKGHMRYIYHNSPPKSELLVVICLAVLVTML